MLTGTLINALAVAAGGTLGVFLGRWGEKNPREWPDRLRQAIGLFSLYLGFRLAWEAENSFLLLAALLGGGLLGSLLRLEGRLSAWSRRGGGGKVAEGFIYASLLFCLGPLTILGSIKDGLSGDFSLLAMKSLMDGLSSIPLAASLGPGVPLSSLFILFYQGGIALAAGWAGKGLPAASVDALSGAGGLLVVGIGVRLLGVAALPLADFLPALLLAPLLALWWR